MFITSLWEKNTGKKKKNLKNIIYDLRDMVIYLNVVTETESYSFFRNGQSSLLKNLLIRNLKNTLTKYSFLIHIIIMY